MATERVTVTLPRELVRRVDRLVRDRGRFIVEAVRHELERRQQALQRSLAHPHPESVELAGADLEGWLASADPGDIELLDDSMGREVRRGPDDGWVELPVPPSIFSHAANPRRQPYGRPRVTAQG